MSTDVMIYANGLSKVFGSFRALDNVNFEVKQGEVVGFLGPNGAGKSTTMRILTCYIAPSRGVVKVQGHDVFDEPLEVRRHLGYLPQRAPLYPDMTVWEYLRFAAEMRGLDEPTFRTRMKKIVEVCGLAQSLGKDIGTLSHGYRQRVGLGQALIHDPPILILDEPTSDLDPNEKAEVIKYIKEIGKDHTILLSTHNLSEVEQACARAIIVSRGRVVADGALDDIRAKSGAVRYVVAVDEKKGLKNGAPKEDEVRAALEKLSGVRSVKDTPTDDRAHAFEISGDKDGDLRADLFRLIVEKGWILLELRRDAQTLEDVFRDLTRGDERLTRGLAAEADDEDEDEDEDEDDEEDEDEEEEGDEEEAPAKKGKKSLAMATQEHKRFGGATLSIAKRELASYFNSPLAYVVICLTQVLLGVLFFMFRGGFWQVDRATLDRLFEYAPYGLCLLVIPVITMRLIAEEKSSGTLEMLITLPVRDWEVVMGKYLGALGLVLILIASTLLYPLMMFRWPWKLGSIDMGPVYSGYLGLVLMSAAAVAIGLLISSVTRSQVIAFFITFVVLFALVFIGYAGDALNSPKLGGILAYVSFQSHLGGFARGLIDTRSVVFFVSIAVFSLMVAFRSLESRKWT
jgi:ABC-2 type transport system ATP-binding protein